MNTKHILSFLFACGLLLSSCGKISRKAEINRDCTGTYLTFNNKDYFVCNPSMISSYADGSQIEVKYDKIDECSSDPDQAICELYHKNYGIIEIKEIK